MGKVIAAITTSVDGYIVGPKDGPEHGLGIGGERLHYWVMGGPWTYADDGHDTDGMHGADREYYESITDGLGARSRSAGPAGPGEVAAQVAPHGVDVIGPVLGVVVLDEQARTAERVIVAGAWLVSPFR